VRRNLITGGMGLVGNYLARQLLAEGEEVVLFEPRAEFPHGSADLAGRVEIAGGDVGEWVHVLEAVRRYRVNCIYHCAAVLSTPCEVSPASGFRTNKDAVRALLDLRRADPSRLRRRMYNIHGFMATLSGVAAVVRRHLPEAQIAFEWDTGEAMRVANRSLSCEMDTTAASEDFGYTLRYPLAAMVVDFIGEVQAGKGG
jgi:nucleoside-diphosphate-sugar epimerase